MIGTFVNETDTWPMPLKTLPTSHAIPHEFSVVDEYSTTEGRKKGLKRYRKAMGYKRFRFPISIRIFLPPRRKKLLARVAELEAENSRLNRELYNFKRIEQNKKAVA